MSGEGVVMGRLRKKTWLCSVLYRRWFPKGVYQQTKRQSSFYTVSCGISDRRKTAPLTPRRILAERLLTNSGRMLIPRRSVSLPLKLCKFKIPGRLLRSNPILISFIELLRLLRGGAMPVDFLSSLASVLRSSLILMCRSVGDVSRTLLRKTSDCSNDSMKSNQTCPTCLAEAYGRRAESTTKRASNPGKASNFTSCANRTCPIWLSTRLGCYARGAAPELCCQTPTYDAIWTLDAWTLSTLALSTCKFWKHVKMWAKFAGQNDGRPQP